MAQTVGDFIFSRMREWGVKRVFGYPGDGINGIVSALGRLKGEVEFIQVRHEEEAAFMACAHAKFCGEVGVCMATSGPGAIHLLNGLYDAKMDHQPVVAIVGQQARTAIGGQYQQEIDLVSLFKDVASEYVQMASAPAQVRHLIDRAFRIAKGERTVTALVIPNDVQEMDYEDPPHQHGTVHTGFDFRIPRTVPTEDDLKRAADVLNAGEKVAILIGAGALHAEEEVEMVANALRAGVAKALLGRAALPDDLPYVTGAIGLLGTRPSWELMRDCDTLLMIGSGFPYSEFLPKEGNARGVQIDIDPKMLSLRYPMEVSLVGDAKETLRALLPLLKKRSNGAWRDTVEKNVREWWELQDERAHLEAEPINPELIAWELSRRLPDDAILTADSGTSAAWFARALKLRRGMMASISGGLATMGCAVPYLTAAKFCHPDRVGIGLVGDGAMQMLGINGLITIAKYWKQWSDPRLILAVFNNRDLNMVTWELRALGGTPKVEATQDLPDFNYAQYAQAIGLYGLRVDKPEEVGPAWDAALEADRPCVIDCVVDPKFLALPPHVTFEQAKNFFAAMKAGDPEAAGILRETYRQMAV
ncbi:MAG TPA: thiamine pyrophosphate-requiring protein [Rhizomicrobium sp.]